MLQLFEKFSNKDNNSRKIHHRISQKFKLLTKMKEKKVLFPIKLAQCKFLRFFKSFMQK